MTSRFLARGQQKFSSSMVAKSSLSGVFAVNKPTGPTSQDVVGKIKKYFQNIKSFQDEFQPKSAAKGGRQKKKKWWLKVGHGGTLDPLAQGVLVIGVGNGTKQLQDYLGGSTKTYQAIALLGSSTTTYDSEGKVLEQTDTSHITNEMIEETLNRFRGDIIQTPPVFSALKMDGKPLYEYARSGEPLPREIQPRNCKIDSIEIVGEGLKYDHQYESPLEEATEKEKEFASQLNSLTCSVRDNEIANDTNNQQIDISSVAADNSKPAGKNPIIEIKFSVSSGTYIRSLIHDLGIALGTTAHMVKLVRLSQGPWNLNKNVFEIDFILKNAPSVWEPPLRHYLNNGPDTDLSKLLSDEASAGKEQDNESNEPSA